MKRLTCDVFHCVLVFQWIFRLNGVNSAVTPYERNESWSIIAIISGRILDQSHQNAVVSSKFESTTTFSAPVQEGNLPFHSARSARKKLHPLQIEPFNFVGGLQARLAILQCLWTPLARAYTMQLVCIWNWKLCQRDNWYLHGWRREGRWTVFDRMAGRLAGWFLTYLS